MEKEKNKKAYWKVAVAFMLLFVLPLGSIYFMNKGINFHKAVTEELEDKGKIGAFKVENQNNLDVSNELLYGRVTVVNFLSDDSEKAKKQAAQIKKVHSSFDDTEDVYFLSFVSADTSESLVDRSLGLGIEDAKQWSLTELNSAEWKNMTDNIFHASAMDEGIVLVDTSLSVRHLYHGYTDSLIGNLVLHISRVVPKQKRRTL